MKSLQLHMINYDFGQNTSGVATNAGMYLRVMVVYDAQANGAFPSATDLLAVQEAGGTAAYNPTSFLNLNNRDRFLVLKDKHWYFPWHGNILGTAAQNMSSGLTKAGPLEFKCYIRLKGLETTYSSSAALANILAASSITTGSLLLFTSSYWLINDGSWSAANADWDWTCNARLRFYD